MSQYCYNNVFIMKSRLRSPITNPAYIDNFSSGVDPDIWINLYSRWLARNENCCKNIFDQMELDKTFDFTLYDVDKNGVPDNFTLDDPRLLKIKDDVLNKTYYVFEKTCKSMTYMDDTRDADGTPIYKIVNFDASQTIRDIITLQDMDIADPTFEDYKNKLYNTCWDVLDVDVQLMKKNDLVWFANDPAKSLILNKIILDLNNPLKNPLLLDNFDSGIDPFKNNKCAPGVQRIVIPPRVNQKVYDKMMDEVVKDPTIETFYPTFVKFNTDGIYNPGHIYDSTYNFGFNPKDGTTVMLSDDGTDMNGNFLIDEDTITDKIDQGDLVELTTSTVPAVIFRKDDDSITYYDVDLGEVREIPFDWNGVWTNLALLAANNVRNPSYDAMQEDIWEHYLDKIDDNLYKLATIRDILEEVNSALIALIDYLDEETCIRLSAALSIKDLDSLLNILGFAECLLNNFREILLGLRNLSNIQRLITAAFGAILGNITATGDIMNRLQQLRQQAMQFLSMLDQGVGASFDIGNGALQLDVGVSLDVQCLLAKTLLDDYLRDGYDILMEMLARGAEFDEILEELKRLRKNLAGEGIKKCLDRYYSNTLTSTSKTNYGMWWTPGQF